MLTTARIREDLIPAGLSWVSALNSNHVRKLIRVGAKCRTAALDVQALEDDQVAETVSSDFPGERLMVCMNPRRREDRRRTREQLLEATEQLLQQIAQRGKHSQTQDHLNFEHQDQFDCRCFAAPP